MNDYIIYIFMFFLGAIFGSFSSVLIDRIHKNEKGILCGRSKCPRCNHILGALDLIPIFTYIFLWGKCRYCKNKVHIKYLLFEIIFGVMFVLTFYKFNYNLLYLIFMLVFVFVFLFITIYDLMYFEVVMPFVYFLITILLIFNLFFNFPTDFWNGFLGALIPGIFFGLLVFLSKEKWMGEGDIYIGICMGLLLGVRGVLLALFFSYILGAFISVIILIFMKNKKDTQVPFVPFLALGTFIVLFWGQEILNIYTNFIYK